MNNDFFPLKMRPDPEFLSAVNTSKVAAFGTFAEMNMAHMRHVAQQFGVPSDIVLSDRERASVVITPSPDIPPLMRDGRVSIDIVPSDILMVSYKRPRPKSRRRQIIRKWHHEPTVMIPDPAIYQIAGRLYGHPDTIKRMITALEHTEICLSSPMQPDHVEYVRHGQTVPNPFLVQS